MKKATFMLSSQLNYRNFSLGLYLFFIGLFKKVAIADQFSVWAKAGFDAAQGDLLGRMKITPEGYAALTRIVKGLAQQYCRGQLVSVLEGGYNLDSLAGNDVSQFVEISSSAIPCEYGRCVRDE